MKRAILLIPATALLVHGQNLIQDPSFESPALTPTSALDSVQFFSGGSTISGVWNVNGSVDRNVLTVHQNFDIYADSVSHGFGPAQAGSQYLDLSGAYFTGTAPTVSQTFATVPGQQYSLSFFLGASDGFNATPNSTHPPLKSVVVQVAPDVGPNLVNDLLTPPAPLSTGNGTQIQWGEHTYLFTASSSSTRLTFQDLSGLDDNTSFVDSVSVQAVPESLPMNWTLGTLAGVTLAGSTRLKRRPSAA
jgi:hypothetical protein